MDDEEKIYCQVCKKELPDIEELKKLDNNLKFSPSHYNICSNECQELGIRANACYKLRSKLRNATLIPYETFKEAMDFPTEGGYADDKYEKMRFNPLLFIHSLDENNFRKFIEMKQP